MNWPTSLFRPAHRPPSATLSKALTGKLLTGLWLELDSDCLFLRFTEKVISVHLDSRQHEDGGRTNNDPWITFPGWLKVQRVMQDAAQVVLEVGSLYTARICIRKSRGRWKIVFQGGRDLAA